VQNINLLPSTCNPHPPSSFCKLRDKNRTHVRIFSGQASSLKSAARIQGDDRYIEESLHDVASNISSRCPMNL